MYTHYSSKADLFLALNIFLALPLQTVVNALRSQALKPDSQPIPGSHRLTRELSEVTGSSTAGRGSQSGEGSSMQDPTCVVALLNVAGMHPIRLGLCVLNCCTRNTSVVVQ